jgi:O-Antigen ligase
MVADSAAVARRLESVRESLRRLDQQAIAGWVLPFLLVFYLGIKGGGYDSIVRDEVGIAVWWILLLGVAMSLLPVARFGPAAWVALGLLAGFAIWTALSISWSESAERSVDETARVVTYLGIFALALSARRTDSLRRTVAALATAIGVIAVLALLSRLHPAWFPDNETAQFLSGARNRLSYPINYWNGLAYLAAMGLPLMLALATTAERLVWRALAAAALPAMCLTIFLTVSRGGAATAILGLLVFIGLASDRLPKLTTMVVAGAGGSILIAAASQRDALQAGLLSDTARDQGNELLAMAIVVCAGVALIQVGIGLAERYGRRPAWSRVGKGRARQALALAIGAAVVVSLATGLPDEVSDAWRDFKSQGGPGTGTERFASFKGNGRYQYWASSADANATSPLEGTGAGTFEFWWAERGDIPGFVRDAHSLFLETLGELGIIGLLLIVGLVAWVLGLSILRTLAALPDRRTTSAAAAAALAAFCLAAGLDWVWELAVLPAAFLLLAAAVLPAGGPRRDPASSTRRDLVARAGVGLVGLAAIAWIALPLAAAYQVRDSQDEASAGRLEAALSDARRAADLQPYAATPRLQEALVLEQAGYLDSAAQAARSATEREATNWKTWVILSRIEAERGRATASVAAYRRARLLNPRSPLFAR